MFIVTILLNALKFVNLGNIIKYWKAIVLVVLLVTIATLWSTNKYKAGKIEDLEVELFTMQTQSVMFEDAIKRQNYQINEFITQGDTQKQKIEESVKEITRIKKDSAKKLAALSREDTGESCEDAMDWLINKAQVELK